MNKSQIPAAQKEVLSLLLDDHRHAQALFRQFESETAPDKKEQIAQTVCTELAVHTMLEEEIFYPYLRQADAEAFGDQLDEAVVEHASVRALIEQLQGMSPKDDLYIAKVTVLGEYVSHHVKEEENEMFPMVVKKKVDLRDILEPLKERKQALLEAQA